MRLKIVAVLLAVVLAVTAVEAAQVSSMGDIVYSIFGVPLLQDDAIEDARKIDPVPYGTYYSITDTVTYRIKYENPYGGPVYDDRYYIDLRANDTIKIRATEDNSKNILVMLVDQSTGRGYTAKESNGVHTLTYRATTSGTYEIRIYPMLWVEGDQAKYTLLVTVEGTPIAYPSINSIVGYGIIAAALIAGLYMYRRGM